VGAASPGSAGVPLEAEQHIHGGHPPEVGTRYRPSPLEQYCQIGLGRSLRQDLRHQHEPQALQGFRFIVLAVGYSGHVGAHAQDHSLKGNFTWHVCKRRVRRTFKRPRFKTGFDLILTVGPPS
jgi:hypothetical protein